MDISNGYIVTWGKKTGTGVVSNVTITLPTSYTTTNYRVGIGRVSTLATTTTGGLYWGNLYNTKAKSSFITGADFNNQTQIDFLTVGY